MKHLFLFIPAILFLISKTELHEFCKMPVLVEHYQQHKKNNPGLSFLDFLFLHYAGEHPEDNDNDEDKELPFKSISDIAHTITPDIAGQENNSAGNLLLVLLQITRQHPEGFPAKAGKTIFHPPRY